MLRTNARSRQQPRVSMSVCWWGTEISHAKEQLEDRSFFSEMIWDAHSVMLSIFTETGSFIGYRSGGGKNICPCGEATRFLWK